MRVIEAPIAVLNDGHPFLAQFPLSISAYGKGWRIRWRSFDTTQQEKIFDDAVAASNWCAWMNRNKNIVESDGLGANFYDCDVMWFRYNPRPQFQGG